MRDSLLWLLGCEGLIGLGWLWMVFHPAKPR